MVYVAPVRTPRLHPQHRRLALRLGVARKATYCSATPPKNSLVRWLWCRWFILNKLLTQKIHPERNKVPPPRPRTATPPQTQRRLVSNKSKYRCKYYLLLTDSGDKKRIKKYGHMIELTNITF